MRSTKAFVMSGIVMGMFTIFSSSCGGQTLGRTGGLNHAGREVIPYEEDEPAQRAMFAAILNSSIAYARTRTEVASSIDTLLAAKWTRVGEFTRHNREGEVFKAGALFRSDDGVFELWIYARFAELHIPVREKDGIKYFAVVCDREKRRYAPKVLVDVTDLHGG